MAVPERLHQEPALNLIHYRRHYDYEGPYHNAVYLVEEFYFNDCRIFCIKTLRAFVDLH